MRPPDWRSARDYAPLLVADRRHFAWEWLRRSGSYRQAWEHRAVAGGASPSLFGLLAFEDPGLATPVARPMWEGATDGHVLDTWIPADGGPQSDRLDIRDFAGFVSVAVDEQNREHWLLSDGRWSIRLDLHDGTLLGGPAPIEHRLPGLQASVPRLDALRQLVALASMGDVPASLLPRERRAARWILELRAADAIAVGAGQQALARALFGPSIASRRWRIENPSYRLRVQRLMRAARERLAAPLAGPWFE